MALLTETQIDGALQRLPGWTREGNAIGKQYTFGSFLEAIDFINAIAPHAEEANHHPEITNVYNRVAIALSTHDEGGITKKDIDMAGKIEQTAGSM